MPYPIEETLLREPNLWNPKRLPVGNVKIDYSVELSQGLKHLWLFNKGFQNEYKDYSINNNHLSNIGTPLTGRHPGIGLTVENNGTSGIAAENASITLSPPLTMAVSFAILSTGNTNMCLMSINDKTTTKSQYAVVITGGTTTSSGDDVSFVQRDGGGFTGVAGPIYVTKKMYRAVVSIESITSAKYYLNGVYLGEDTTNTSFTINSVTIGRLGDSSPNWEMNAQVWSACIWEKALGYGEVKQDYLDPYSVLIPA